MCSARWWERDTARAEKDFWKNGEDEGWREEDRGFRAAEHTHTFRIVQKHVCTASLG